ncbi:molybdopterin-dependent oxidoreductase [Gordonia sp. CPCC 205515]|uniref:molybdopterin-dependent oxidoreductase n=1 Tax=Gordonia sp. CPCC 205515 TaxID=3140791 RepID=UPI003AF3E1A2
MTSTRTESDRLGAAAIAGVVAVGAGLAIGELVAVAVSPDASPYFAVGSAVVDHTPTSVREWVIGTFGTSDKLVLFVLMGVLMAIIAAGCGVAERLRPPTGSVIVGLFGVVGVLAAVTRPNASWTYAIPSVIAGVVAVVVLRILIGMLRPAGSARDPDAATPGVSRRFVLTAVGIGVAALAVGAIGRRMLADTAHTIADRAGVKLPVPRTPAPPIPPGVNLDVPGATSYVTDNADFYRIDTALQVPSMTTDQWSLRIHGMVDNEIHLGWDELLAMPMTERVVTLTCVSNEVGGDLIGNARWLGVPMKTLLDRAGVRPGADMLLSTSVDGWTCGTPVSAITDGRDALLAVGMNGDALPVEHGYPVRQVIPGLYGYVSATKWVVDWEITKFSDADAYWTTRGWSALGPIKLASRIDRPASGSSHQRGEVVIAGTAWAQHTGVRAVEVQIDDGVWEPAELATEYSIDTWRQWRFTWVATPGEHTVRCRAIDKDGRRQVESIASPIPDGATGFDARTYTIT